MIATQEVQSVETNGWSFQLVSRQGFVRKRNEDTAIVLPDVHLAGRRVHVIAVFDGVGGWPSGDVAGRRPGMHWPRCCGGRPGRRR